MGPCRILLLEFGEQGSIADELKSVFAANASQAAVKHERVNRASADAKRLCGLAVSSSASLSFMIADGRSSENALTVLKSLNTALPALPVFVVVDPQAQPGLDLLAQANDFMMTPLRSEEVMSRVRRWIRFRRPDHVEVGALKEKVGLKQLVGSSPAFLAAVKKIPPIARSDASVMILGETGTGKEVFARATHYLSARTAAPFLPVNCGAIPTELMENELFGHAAGAYTGATCAASGLVKECDGGTLFLDEVDTLPPLAQAKLLRFLQDKEFRPLGSQKTLRTDVRVIAASNADVRECVRRGAFREDLFFRLNVLSLELPPLREREGDIAVLACHFLEKLRSRSPHGPKAISPGALQRLEGYAWPGNVRELENVLEGSAVFCSGRILESGDIRLPQGAASNVDDSFQAQKARVIARFEESFIRRMLAVHQNNISQAARAAGKDRRTFWELMRKYDLHRIATAFLLSCGQGLVG